MTLRISVNGTCGASSRSSASLALNSSRSVLGDELEVDRRQSTWPIFIAAPFICPSCAGRARRRRPSPARRGARRPLVGAEAVRGLSGDRPSRSALCRRRGRRGSWACLAGTGRGIFGIRASARGADVCGTCVEACPVGARCPPRCSSSTPPRCCTARSSRCPASITGTDGRPVNALLGMANLILQVVRGAQAARRGPVLRVPRPRSTASSSTANYHADRPEMPDDLAAPVGATPRRSSPRSGGRRIDVGELEADDLLGALAQIEDEAGGEALLFTGDRDMFQCVTDAVTVLFPGGKGGPQLIDAAGVARALRDRARRRSRTSSRCAATRPTASPAPRASARRPPPSSCASTGTLEDAHRQRRADRTPAGVAAALRDQADELRDFRDIATLQPVDGRAPRRRPAGLAPPQRPRPRARDAPAGGAPREARAELVRGPQRDGVFEPMSAQSWSHRAPAPSRLLDDGRAGLRAARRLPRPAPPNPFR